MTLDGLSHIVNPELARDISPELIAMLNHSRPNIRKRAILALYKTLVKYPEAINQARVRLEEKLEDPDPCQCPLNFLGRPILISLGFQLWLRRQLTYSASLLGGVQEITFYLPHSSSIS